MATLFVRFGAGRKRRGDTACRWEVRPPTTRVARETLGKK